MITQTQEQERESLEELARQAKIPRRVKIQELYYKLRNKYFDLASAIHERYENQLDEIQKKCEGLELGETLELETELGYYDILEVISQEMKVLDQTPLGRLAGLNTFSDPRNLFDRSDHENMRYASGLFKADTDPVVKKVLTDKVCNWSTKKSRKRQEDRAKIYTGTMTQDIYEKYLSEVVGRPITMEEYEIKHRKPAKRDLTRERELTEMREYFTQRFSSDRYSLLDGGITK